MSTRTSTPASRVMRRRLLLAGLITISGCIGGMSGATAEDSAPPSFVTFRQLFQSEASKASVTDGSTPLAASQANDVTSSPSLVTFLQLDSATKGDVRSPSDAAPNKKDGESDAQPKSATVAKPEGDRLGGESIFGGDAKRSPSVEGGRFELPPFMVATTQTSEIGNGRTPEGFRGSDDQLVALLPESGLERGLDWDWTVRCWAAPNTFSHPRYFEDRMLERHGHERFPYLQPLASGARFFGTVPLLPYLMAVRHPCDCEYTLGYYRSGSCAPNLKQRPPYERKAVVAQAAAVATTALILP